MASTAMDLLRAYADGHLGIALVLVVVVARGGKFAPA
jgi:hypothetical protein